MINLIDKDTLEGYKEVTSSAVKNKRNEYDKAGIFSDIIFNTSRSCDCKHLVGNYYADGEICPKCNTGVKQNEDRGAIIRLPKNHRIINPHIIRILKDNGVDILSKLKYDMKITLEGSIREEDESSIFTFSKLNNDYDKFIDDILAHCNANLDEAIVEYLRNNKEKVLMDKIYVLPISFRPTNMIKKGSDTYIPLDIINNFYIRILNNLTDLDDNMDNIADNLSEVSLFNIQSALMELNSYLIKSILSGKNGIIRNHLLSNRINFSARCYITIRSDSLPYDAVTLPRSLFLEVYKHRVLRTMIEMNEEISHNNCLDYYMRNRFNVKDEILNSAMKKVIDTEDLVVIINRNPSLKIDSLIGMRVDSIWDNDTMGIPKIILPMISGDVDGDTLAIFTIETEEAKKELRDTIMITNRLADVYGFSSFNKLLLPFEDNNVGLYLLDDKNYKKWIKNRGDK